MSKRVIKNTLFDELKRFSGSSFRDIYKHYLYIDCRDLLEKMLPGALFDDITGIFAYCYIDKTEGISFRPFLLAALAELRVQVFSMPHVEDTIYVLRLREGDIQNSELHQGNRHMYLYSFDPEKHSYFDFAALNIPVEDFAEIGEDIDSTYNTDPDVEDLRSEKYQYLDSFRHKFFPDDVRVLLFNKKNGIEEVWVRLMFANGKELFGTLLNEPFQEYGCHKGNIIGLTMTRSGERKALLFNGRTAEIVDP